mgnify:FL=1
MLSYKHNHDRCYTEFLFTHYVEGLIYMFDNLNYYRVFYTVANTGNISKAADMLFISQPAISKAISKLEDGLHVKLFLRSSKGVTMTDEGQVLYSHIEKAFSNISQGEDEIRHIHELGIGQVRIGVSTSLCKHILLDKLQTFISENPHIKIIIDCHSTVNTLKLLNDGRIDIGLICKTDIPAGFEYQDVSTIHDIFVVNETYLSNLHLREQEELVPEQVNPWLFAGNLIGIMGNIQDAGTDESRKNSRLSVQSENEAGFAMKDILEKSNLMLLEKNNITRTHIDDYLESEGIHPQQILEVNNMDLLIDFAAIGMGVASVVREFATDYLASGQILELPLSHPVAERTVGFVYPKSREKSEVLRKFLGMWGC